MENTNEIWKPICGYEGLYEVSNMGRVRSLDVIVNCRNGSKQLRKGRVLKACIANHGYYYVGLYKNGKHKKYTIHRLVGEAFLENPNNLPCINHKDENKLNNRVENLEWVTQKHNLEYSGIIEKGVKKSAELRSKPVIQYTKDGQFVAEYTSAAEAERQNGISQAHISKVCLGIKRYKSAGGFVWRYK